MLAKIKGLFKCQDQILNDSQNLWDSPLESELRLCRSLKEDWICVKMKKRNFECYPLDEPE